MTVTTDSKIANLDLVRPNITNQRGTNQKAISIELDAAPIIVVVKTPLNRVALADEILPKDVGDVDVLMPRVETIETAVGILLQHREVRAVELVAIVIKRTEDARAEVVIGKDEAAKVGDKRLYTGAHGNEIVVRINVCKLNFA